MRKVHEKRSIVRILDQPAGFIRQALAHVLTGRAGLQCEDRVWREISAAGASATNAKDLSEPLTIGPETGVVSQVLFTKKPSVVARLLQNFRNCFFLQW